MRRTKGIWRVVRSFEPKFQIKEKNERQYRRIYFRHGHSRRTIMGSKQKHIVGDNSRIFKLDIRDLLFANEVKIHRQRAVLRAKF